MKEKQIEKGRRKKTEEEKRESKEYLKESLAMKTLNGRRMVKLKKNSCFQEKNLYQRFIFFKVENFYIAKHIKT